MLECDFPPLFSTVWMFWDFSETLYLKITETEDKTIAVVIVAIKSCLTALENTVFAADKPSNSWKYYS